MIVMFGSYGAMNTCSLDNKAFYWFLTFIITQRTDGSLPHHDKQENCKTLKASTFEVVWQTVNTLTCHDEVTKHLILLIKKACFS